MKRYFSVNTAKTTGTSTNPPVWKSSASGQFPQILRRLTRKSVETVHRRKTSTPKNQKIFRHFTRWKLRLLLFVCDFYSAQVSYVSYDCLRLLELQKTTWFWNFHHCMSLHDPCHLFAVNREVEYVVCRYLNIFFSIIFFALYIFACSYCKLWPRLNSHSTLKP